MKRRSKPEPIPADLSRRVWVREVRPSVDGGEFPVKRSLGDTVDVTADIFTDGHDEIAAVLRWRTAASTRWSEAPMERLGNDIWRGRFELRSVEPHQFTILAWIDHFASWRDGLRKKADAGMEVRSELLEGAVLLRAAARRARASERRRLEEQAAALEAPGDPGTRVEQALAPSLAELMARHDPRERATEADRIYEIDASRERARVGAWYEMFPRSYGPDPRRGGSFADAEARLAEIARMGFDVLYLPPIHPIGTTNRKGRNNALRAAPGHPGSPWAIGGEAGGHKAVHPGLGSLADFDRFLQTAASHDLEIALDIAFQCSPDHPWVREHPEWFRRRPDGTVKYAENPPKKYQDIYPLNFDCEAWQELWHELKSVIEFWAARGVRIFRVDNPHTKPLRFWGWLISEVKREYPDAIFLSEAFTRPKVMNTLAKIGFDQSYTYFTWRNTKAELTEYLVQLVGTELREFLRPNFFVNTPDILPQYLQYGGRPAFITRLVLAATLGASYGIYSGFEICEARAVPGTEEYLDSEKYEIRPWDWNRPGHIRDIVARVNRIRRENPALARNERLRFYEVDNDQILCFVKTTEDLANVILVAVNLDPHHAHEGWVRIPLQELGIAPNETFQVHDLLGDGRYLWQGTRHFLRLDPAVCPAQIFRLRKRIRTERDFDYFM